MSKSRQNNIEFDALVDALLQGDLTVEQSERLQAMVISDPDCRRRYLEQVDLHARLLRLNRDADTASLVSISSNLAATYSGRLSWLLHRLPPAIVPEAHPVRFFAVCAAMTFVFITALWMIATSWIAAPQGPRLVAESDRAGELHFVARITGGHEEVWAAEAQQYLVWSYLQPGQKIVLDSGLIEVTFNDGSVVLLQGPCAFQVDSPTACTLDAGELTARAPPRGVGFAIDTPSARIVDLGTEFGVSVNQSKGTFGEVYVGQVEMASLVNGELGPPLRLAAGEAAHARPGERELLAAPSTKLLTRVLPRPPRGPRQQNSFENRPPTEPGVLTWTGKAGNSRFFDEANWDLNGTGPPRAGAIEPERWIGHDAMVRSAAFAVPQSARVYLGDGRTWEISDTIVKGELNTSYHPIGLDQGGSATINLRGSTEFTYGWAWDIQWNLYDDATLIALNANHRTTGVLGKSSQLNFVGTGAALELPKISVEQAVELAPKIRVRGMPAVLGDDPLVAESGDNLLLENSEAGGTCITPLPPVAAQSAPGSDTEQESE